MQYQVPQFIDVEDKIFGPLTIKQFIYLTGGGGLSYLLFALLPSYIAFLLIIPIAGFSLALAFYKVNEKPFINVLESAFVYFFSHKLYIWKKHEKKVAQREEIQITSESRLAVPTLSQSKLKDLAWSLDVNQNKSGTIYSKESGQLEKRENYTKPF